VAVARSLGGLVQSEAAQGDRDALVTAKVVQAWKDAGLYKLVRPVELGGEGLDSVSFLEVVEEISRQDAAAGWTYAIHTVGSLFPGLLLTAAAYRELLGPEGNGVACGFAFGKVPGTARPVEGGYLVQSEPMPFGSGTQHADRVASMLFLLDENGENVIGDDGAPVVVNSYSDRRQVEWLNNWNAAGLKGTGSGHYRIKEHVLEEKWLSVAKGERVSAPVYRQGFHAIVHLLHSGVALGVAKRALEELARSAKGRRRGDIAALDEHPIFQADFVRLDADYRAARALLFEAYRQIWDAAVEDRVVDLHTARVEQADLHLNRVLRELVSKVSVWAGSDAIPAGGIIARLNADTSVALNHLLLSPHQDAKIAPQIIDATITSAH
jgi:alkylation response protein AidB-like acyl-CoA dehydrogenase